MLDKEDISISELILKVSEILRNKFNFFNSISRTTFHIGMGFRFVGREDLIYKLLMPLRIDKNEIKRKYLWKAKYSLTESLKRSLNEENF